MASVGVEVGVLVGVLVGVPQGSSLYRIIIALFNEPTAQTSFDDTTATADARPLMVLGTFVHCVPSQCMVNNRVTLDSP